MDAVTLEGFLTAIAIGPVTVTPEHWLPHGFGSDPEDPMPKSPSIKHFERGINLIILGFKVPMALVCWRYYARAAV